MTSLQELLDIVDAEYCRWQMQINADTPEKQETSTLMQAGALSACISIKEALLSDSVTIKTARRNMGLTQAQLAKAIGTSHVTVSRIENGAYPNSKFTKKLEEFLNVKLK